MKKTIILLGFVLASCLTTVALGQLGQPALAGDILGHSIKDAQDQKVGIVKDLAIDLQNGRVVEVIIGRGGFLGVDQTTVAALPENFSLGVDGKALRINIDPKNLDAAPAVDMSKWKTGMEQPKVEQVYRYYGVTPYFLVEEHTPHASSPPTIHRLGEVTRASELIGTEVVNNQGEKIGKVSNLIVDLPQDRTVEVIIKSGRFLDQPGELSAVPPQALRPDASTRNLELDMTKAALAAAPHFPGAAWPQIDRSQATLVYQAYHVTPYFLPIGPENTVQNAPSVNSKTLTPLETGTGPADLQITAKIRQEIMDTPSLAQEAANIKIVTVNGHVTLRGMVATMEEKRLVGEIASRIVPEADVENQLEVRETASNTVN